MGKNQPCSGSPSSLDTLRRNQYRVSSGTDLQRPGAQSGQSAIAPRVGFAVDLCLCRASAPAGAFTREGKHSVIRAATSADGHRVLCRWLRNLRVDRNQPLFTG